MLAGKAIQEPKPTRIIARSNRFRSKTHGLGLKYSQYFGTNTSPGQWFAIGFWSKRHNDIKGHGARLENGNTLDLKAGRYARFVMAFPHSSMVGFPSASLRPLQEQSIPHLSLSRSPQISCLTVESLGNDAHGPLICVTLQSKHLNMMHREHFKMYFKIADKILNLEGPAEDPEY